MRERERHLRVAMDGVPDTWRIAPRNPDRAEHLAQVGWFHEQMSGLYDPIVLALSRLRDGDTSGIEPAIRFLEADVYCHRSGYLKADVIRELTKVDLDPKAIDRLRAVVLMVVESYDRREFRSYCRLARRVDSEPFRGEIRERLGSDISATRRHARWVLAALGEGPTMSEADQTQRRRWMLVEFERLSATLGNPSVADEIPAPSDLREESDPG